MEPDKPLRYWRPVRRRRWWFACVRSCWRFARGMRRTRWCQTEDSSRVLKKSNVVDHEAVGHDHRNAEGASTVTRPNAPGGGFSSPNFRLARSDLPPLPKSGIDPVARSPKVAVYDRRLRFKLGAERTTTQHLDQCVSVGDQ